MIHHDIRYSWNYEGKCQIKYDRSNGNRTRDSIFKLVKKLQWFHEKKLQKKVFVWLICQKPVIKHRKPWAKMAAWGYNKLVNNKILRLWYQCPLWDLQITIYRVIKLMTILQDFISKILILSFDGKKAIEFLWRLLHNAIKSKEIFVKIW